MSEPYQAATGKQSPQGNLAYCRVAFPIQRLDVDRKIRTSNAGKSPGIAQFSTQNTSVDLKLAGHALNVSSPQRFSIPPLRPSRRPFGGRHARLRPIPPCSPGSVRTMKRHFQHRTSPPNAEGFRGRDVCRARRSWPFDQTSFAKAAGSAIFRRKQGRQNRSRRLSQPWHNHHPFDLPFLEGG